MTIRPPLLGWTLVLSEVLALALAAFAWWVLRQDRGQTQLSADARAIEFLLQSGRCVWIEPESLRGKGKP